MGIFTFTWREPVKHTAIVSGTFDNWQKTIQLVKQPNGEYSATIPLKEEKVLYKFVIDGEWIVDRHAKVEKGDGIENNYLDAEDILKATEASGKGIPELGGLPLGEAKKNLDSTSLAVATGSTGIVIPDNAAEIKELNTVLTDTPTPSTPILDSTPNSDLTSNSTSTPNASSTDGKSKSQKSKNKKKKSKKSKSSKGTKENKENKSDKKSKSGNDLVISDEKINNSETVVDDVKVSKPVINTSKPDESENVENVENVKKIIDVTPVNTTENTDPVVSKDTTKSESASTEIASLNIPPTVKTSDESIEYTVNSKLNDASASTTAVKNFPIDYSSSKGSDHLTSDAGSKAPVDSLKEEEGEEFKSEKVKTEEVKKVIPENSDDISPNTSIKNSNLNSNSNSNSNLNSNSNSNSNANVSTSPEIINEEENKNTNENASTPTKSKLKLNPLKEVFSHKHIKNESAKPSNATSATSDFIATATANNNQENGKDESSNLSEVKKHLKEAQNLNTQPQTQTESTNNNNNKDDSKDVTVTASNTPQKPKNKISLKGSDTPKKKRSFWQKLKKIVS